MSRCINFWELHLLLNKVKSWWKCFDIISPCEICMSNLSPWQKKIWPDLRHNVGVRTPKQLVIAFENGYFCLFLCSVSDNGMLHREATISCLSLELERRELSPKTSLSTLMLANVTRTHTDSSSGFFHSSFYSWAMLHPPVTCCADSKQEWMMDPTIQLGVSSCHWG